MATDHPGQLLNQAIELVIYSEGGITWDSIENMSADEFYYIIYNFKKAYEDKQKARQDFIKTVFEFVKQSLDVLFKLLGSLGGKRRNG